MRWQIYVLQVGQRFC